MTMEFLESLQRLHEDWLVHKNTTFPLPSERCVYTDLSTLLWYNAIDSVQGDTGGLTLSFVAFDLKVGKSAQYSASIGGIGISDGQHSGITKLKTT